jgi:hypothetical protein
VDFNYLHPALHFVVPSTYFPINSNSRSFRGRFSSKGRMGPHEIHVDLIALEYRSFHALNSTKNFFFFLVSIRAFSRWNYSRRSVKDICYMFGRTMMIVKLLVKLKRLLVSRKAIYDYKVGSFGSNLLGSREGFLCVLALTGFGNHTYKLESISMHLSITFVYCRSSGKPWNDPPQGRGIAAGVLRSFSKIRL